MSNDFEINEGVLTRYLGTESRIVVPYGVVRINAEPHIVIPEGVTKIDFEVFKSCIDVTSVTVPDGVTEIGVRAFSHCSNLTSICIPDSVTKICAGAFSQCSSLTSINIPEGVTEIEDSVFEGCTSLSSVSIPDGVTTIKSSAFCGCTSLTSITIPDGVPAICNDAFRDCKNLTSVIIPDSVCYIGFNAFSGCEKMKLIVVPPSVAEIKNGTFDYCPELTVICSEDSAVHHYCNSRRHTYLFDYQYKAFHGLIPPGIEKLSSPFLADEEKPYIFISYSHKDRDEVLQIIKTLYESGWKIWYDEGLTIGDRYDETLEEHVKNCTVFLLFVSENSVNSYYCIENEIPWAIQYNKPIIKCLLDKGLDCDIREGAVASTVTPADIEPALENVSGLIRGERREAKGISVVVNPADRDGAEGDGFAYCLYTGEHAAIAKAIMHDARNGGCTLYDAVEEGADKEKLQNCACLIVFLDKEFLSDEALTKILTEAYQAGRDIAVCQVESISNEDLPQELIGLHKMQWLHFAHGINADMNTKLARHLQKRGCRNTATLPGFEYEKTDKGIVITRYTGSNPNPRIESEYGGISVVEIAKEAFRDNIRLKAITIPDSVTVIGKNAFMGCTNLSSVIIGNGVTIIDSETFKDCTGLTSVTLSDHLSEIGQHAFQNCQSLNTVTIPDSVTYICWGAFFNCAGLNTVKLPGRIKFIESEVFKGCVNLTSVTIPDSVKTICSHAFDGCTGLASITIPDSVTKIESHAFRGCINLTVITIPDSVTEIESSVFCGCTGLTAIMIPDNVTEIESSVFCGCTGLKSISIPGSVTEIGYNAFGDCTGLTSATIPDSVKRIGDEAFSGCPNLTVICSPDSYARKYCKEKGIPVRSASPDQNEEMPVETEPSVDPTTAAQNIVSQDTGETPSGTPEANQTKPARPGFFERLFGKK